VSNSDVMTNAERVEVAIRAAQIAKCVLALLEDHGIHATRLHLAIAARQFNDLNAVLVRIQSRARDTPGPEAAPVADPDAPGDHSQSLRCGRMWYSGPRNPENMHECGLMRGHQGKCLCGRVSAQGPCGARADPPPAMEA
jgi:hypothetical protein